MTNAERLLLKKQAQRLVMLGITVKHERKNLKKMVAQGITYNDPKMLQALECLEKTDAEWKRLETEHLELRKILGVE